MRLYRDLKQPRLSQGSVVTIGNFDGVHKGHQVLLERLGAHGGQGLDLAAITFEPSPLAWFQPDLAPPRLTSPRQKAELFHAAGVDLVWMMRFNEALAGLSARDFAVDALVEALSARRVIVGDDFRFGRRREGGLEQLAEFGREFGFDVEVVPEVADGGGRISSSAVREALAKGDFRRAEKLLGRPYRMQGCVFHGAQLGRKLGYPTANMKLAARPSPISGIFAVRTRICDKFAPGGWREGVANLGHRPAVGGGDFLVEVHLFDFGGDLYGLRLEVEFVEKIRNEANFESLDALKAQMRRDEARARDILNKKRG